VIIKRVVQSLLGGVIVTPPEDRGERWGTKGREFAFDQNGVAEVEAAVEVEVAGTADAVQY
jgi:hypothetical protein